MKCSVLKLMVVASLTNPNQSLRTKVIDEMLKQLKKEIEYEFHGDKQWVYGMSLNIKELDDIIEAINDDYKLATKVIIKMDESDLVDGAIVDYNIEKINNGTIKLAMDLGFTDESPAYNGGTVEEGIKWLSQDEVSGGNNIVYLDMQDEKYSSYKIEAEK